MWDSDKLKFIARGTGETIALGQVSADMLIRYQSLYDSSSKDSRRHAEGYRISLQINAGLTAEQLSQTWERVHEYD